MARSPTVSLAEKDQLFQVKDALNQEYDEVKKIVSTLSSLRQPPKEDRSNFYDPQRMKKDPDIWDPPPPRAARNPVNNARVPSQAAF